MKDSDKPMYLGDPKAKQKEIDRVTANVFPIKPDEIMKIAKAVGETHAYYMKALRSKVTLERAKRIRDLRSSNSWRIVAGATFLEWGADADWYPQNNQIAGMALCEIAAALLGEDYTQEPWT